MGRIVFIDTETTGLQAHRHEVWEIAIIERRNSGAVFEDVEHVWHVRPDLQKADPAALRLNRFYERTAPLDAWKPGQPGKGWDPQREASREVARLLAGATIVGLNPTFDVAFFERWLWAQGQCGAWDYHLVDVRAMALGWLHAKVEPPERIGMSSDVLAVACGVDPVVDGRHTAIGDARWVRDWYDKLTGVV